MLHRGRGFTLIELMIAVAVVGILGMIAFPSYVDYMRRSKLQEGTSQLLTMRTKMEQYFQDQRTFVGACTNGTVAPLPNPATLKNFTMDCPVRSATQYTVRATGTGDLAGLIYTITEANVRATTVTSGTAMANAGYTANTGCWVQRKGGAC